MPKLESEDTNRAELIDLLVTLADQNGVTPQDVLTHPPCWPALRKHGVTLGTYTSMMVHEASAKARQGIRKVIARVDEHNTAVLASSGMNETHVADNGDVKLARKKSEPAVPKAKKSEGDHGSGARVEILGYPSTSVIRVMGHLGFGFSAARKALDELGGSGIADSTIRANLPKGKRGEDLIEMPDDTLAELVAYLL